LKSLHLIIRFASNGPVRLMAHTLTIAERVRTNRFPMIY